MMACSKCLPNSRKSEKEMIEMDNERNVSPVTGIYTDEMIGRIVSVSILATFLRNFATTYLNKDERRIFLAFQRFAADLERKEMDNMRCRR